MAQNTTNIDSALKEYYLPPAVEQLNNKSMMLSQIERNSRHIEGRRAVLSLHVSIQRCSTALRIFVEM